MFGGGPEFFSGTGRGFTPAAGESGAIEVKKLDTADVYLWLPLRKREISVDERQALAKWLDQGGVRREIHYHWAEGSVEPDGLRGDHSAALESVYQSALDIDYKALSAAQDRVIARLRAGVVRVRTPAGTDISFRVGDRPFNKQDGDASPAHARGPRAGGS